METDCGVGDRKIVCRGQKSPEDEIVISAQGGWLGKSLTQMFCLSFILKENEEPKRDTGAFPGRKTVV